MGFTDSSAGKESVCNAGGLGSIPGLRRSPGESHGNPLQYSCLENPHGQRNLAGYSPAGYYLKSNNEMDLAYYPDQQLSVLMRFCTPDQAH